MDPSETTSGTGDRQETEFQVRFWPVCLFFSLPAWAVMTTFLLLADRHITWSKYATIMGPILVVLTVASAWYAFRFRVRLSPTGIRGQDARGMPVTADFAQVTGVKMLRLPWLTYYRVQHRPRMEELWLPRFLRDEERFLATACSYMDEANPLRRVLDERRQELGLSD